jgi:hypothetical protein
MAIANSYPKATPKADDLILGTVTPAPNSTQSPVTRNFEIDALADLIVSETGGITGSGTLNTIAMFTPNGQAIGDSRITQAALGAGINVNTNLTVSDDLNVTGSIETSSNLEATGTTTLNGPLEVNSTYYDAAGDEGTDGDLLVAKGTPGNMATRWVDRNLIVSETMAKLIPFQVTASAGGSSTYSADNNIVEIGWTGGNGTYALNIPSATTIPYRNIRFVTNSTFPNGASDKVQITAQAGETIDGAAFFEISKQYEGVSIWSNGTEWIVIQAKAH